jgi:hypothetical protein
MHMLLFPVLERPGRSVGKAASTLSGPGRPGSVAVDAAQGQVSRVGKAASTLSRPGRPGSVAVDAAQGQVSRVGKGGRRSI